MVCQYSKQRNTFDASLDLSNAAHNVDTFWDKIVKPVSTAAAKVVTEEEKMQKIDDYLERTGTIVNRITSSIESNLGNSSFWNMFSATKGALGKAAANWNLSEGIDMYH